MEAQRNNVRQEALRIQNAENTKLPMLSVLSKLQGEALLFSFAEFDEEVVETLTIEKLVPLPLDIIKVEDVNETIVGDVTSIRCTLSDWKIKFSGCSLSGTPKCYHTGTGATGQSNRNTARTGAASNEGQLSIAGTGVTIKRNSSTSTF